MKQKFFLYLLVAIIAIAGNSCQQTDDAFPTTVDYEVSAVNFIAPCHITFYSTASIGLSYFWDFGDGSTSTQVNPDHIFYTAGSYDVKLTVSDGQHSESRTKTIRIIATASRCRITKVAILNCPLKTSWDVDWDYGTSPDFYFNLETATGSVLFSSSSSSNNSLFPITWNFDYSIFSNSFNNTYKVHIWEHDELDADDDVSYTYFVPADYTKAPNAYPASIVMTRETTDIQFELSWE
jgi:PKD repeat protein